MSSNFNAWDTSESAGDLAGTLSADRASGPTFAEVLGQPGPVQPPPQAPAIAVTPFAESLDKLGQLGQFMASTQVPQKNLLKNISINTETGTVKIDTDQGALAEVFGQLKDLQTMKSAAMARVAQLRQQESSGSPILDALSQFAGNMAANDPTMPGWVRALGQTNLQMGSQGISAKRKEEEAKAFAYTKEISDIGLEAMKLQDEKYKMTLSFLDTQKKATAAEDKAGTDALLKWRKEGRAQIDATGGEYDVEGFAGELDTLPLTPEQKEAQLSSMVKYAADRKNRIAELAKITDARERRKRAEELADMGTQFERGLEKQRIQMSGGFSNKVMAASIPKPANIDYVKSLGDSLLLLDKAEAYLGTIPAKYRGGPIKGWLGKHNPWRDSKDDQALQNTHGMTLAALKISGLAPISEIEFSNQAKNVFDIEKTWDQNMKTITRMRELALKGGERYLRGNSLVNWSTAQGMIPKQLQPILPELEEARTRAFAEMAPENVQYGVDPEIAAASRSKVGEVFKFKDGWVKRTGPGAGDFEVVKGPGVK